jgi:hypothetical protein
MFKTDNIVSISEGKKVCCSAQSSINNERLNLHLVKEETPFLKHINE